MFRINPVPIAFAVVIVAFLVFVIAKEVVRAHRRQASTEREEMHISVLPKTSLGKWSVGLAIAFILFFILLLILTGSNPFGPGTNPVLAVVLKIIFVGLPGAAFVTGLVSMIKRKERSVLVFVSTALGLWFLICGVGLLIGLG